MALQQINWDQINSEYVPSGSAVNLGSSSTPLTAVHTDSLFINGVNITGSGSGTSGSSGSSGTSGATGAAGSSGSSGTSGGSGSSGTSGTSGTSGISGTSGSSGSSGVNGTSGTSGSSGSSGLSGSSGTSGQSGSSGSSGTSGARGSSGTSGTSGAIYLTTSNTTLTDIDELVGTTQTIFVDTQLSYSVGQLIVVAYDVNNFLIGRVSTYSPLSGQLVFVVLSVSGASSHNDWTVNLYASGTSGGAGVSSITVADGSTTINNVDKIVFSGATISDLGGGDVRVSIVGGGGGGTGSSGTSGTSGTSGVNGTSGSSGSSGTSSSIYVKEQGGSPINNISGITFSGATVVDNGSGNVTVQITGGGGSGSAGYQGHLAIWKFSTNTNTNVAPSSGYFTVNTASWGTSTNSIAFSNNSFSPNIDFSTYLDSLSNGGLLKLVKANDPSIFKILQINSTTPYDVGYENFTVTQIAVGGTDPSADDEFLLITMGEPGVAGSSGTSGSSGVDGSSGTSGINGSSGTSGSSGLDGTNGSSGTSGSSGSNGSSGTSGISGVDGTSGTSGSSGSSGTSGINGSSGTSGSSGLDGTNGSSGTSGSAGSSGTSGTSPLYVDATIKVYQVILNLTGGSLDPTTPIDSVIGPNGENKTTLESDGWSFTIPSLNRLSVSRPSGLQTQPIVNVMTHGVNGINVLSKSPNGTTTAQHSVFQTYSGGNWTTMDVYSINSTNTGAAGSGSTNVIITFGITT